MTNAKRSSFQIDPVLEQLKTGRQGAITVMTGTKPFGETYKLALAVNAAIDALAKDLTGDGEYFWRDLAKSK